MKVADRADWVVGGTDHLLPDDRVGAVTRRPVLGPLGGPADRCVDRVQRDRSDDVDSLLPQRTDHSVGGLPRQVGETRSPGGLIEQPGRTARFATPTSF